VVAGIHSDTQNRGWVSPAWFRRLYFLTDDHANRFRNSFQFQEVGVAANPLMLASATGGSLDFGLGA
jgi:hypothetical protein